MSNASERKPDDTRKHNRSQRNTLIAILDKHLNEALESGERVRLELCTDIRDGMIVGKSATRTISYKND